MRICVVKRQVNHLYREVLPGLYLPLVLYLISLFTSDLPCGFFTQCQTLCNRMDCSPPVFAVMGFSRSGLPFPSPEDLPDSGSESRSPALQADSLPSEPPGKLI